MNILYLMDPLCGWCYGNSETILKLSQAYKVDLLPGGMIAGQRVGKMTPDFRNYVKQAGVRVTQLTGATFGAEYYKAIEHLELDSEPPSRALMTVKHLWPDKTVPFSAELQKAHFQKGQDLNDIETYRELVPDFEKFEEYFNSDEAKKETQKAFHIAQSLTSGFPTTIIIKENKIHESFSGYVPYEQINEAIAKA